MIFQVSVELIEKCAVMQVVILRKLAFIHISSRNQQNLYVFILTLFRCTRQSGLYLTVPVKSNRNQET